MHLFYKNVGIKAAVRGVTSSSTALRTHVAHPREITNAHVAGSSRCDDWLLAEVSNEQVVFSPFSPAEVDEGMADLARLAGRPILGALSATDCDSNSGGEIDNSADEVIEMTRVFGASDGGAGPSNVLGMEDRASQIQLDELLRITSKLMQRPGMQREVVRCMIEDPEVRNLMYRQSSDLDAYLMAAGISTPGLLTPGELPHAAAHRTLVSRFTHVGSSSTSSVSDRADGEGQDEDPSAFDALLRSVTNMMEGVAGVGRNVITFLKGWMRDRMSELSGERAGERKAGANGQEVCDEGFAGRPLVKAVMSGVMVLAMVCMVMMLLKRPMMLRRVVM